NPLPLAKRAVRPVFISDTVTVGTKLRHLLRYPGALLIDKGGVDPPNCQAAYNPDPGNPATLSNPTNLTVGIPRVISRNPAEHIEWIPLLAEVRSNPADPASGPFSFSSPGVQKGVVAAMLNYPFQSAALSGFRPSPEPGNITNV